MASVGVGVACPLTALEKRLRERAGEEGYGGGFVDRYVEDVVYPGELTPLLRALAAAAVVAGYARLLARTPRRPHGRGGSPNCGPRPEEPPIGVARPADPGEVLDSEPEGDLRGLARRGAYLAAHGRRGAGTPGGPATRRSATAPVANA